MSRRFTVRAAALCMSLLAIACEQTAQQRSSTIAPTDQRVQATAETTLPQAAASLLPKPTPQAVRIEHPASVDLRPRLLQLGLTPRPQGRRGTCSIFTTCSSIEFANAQLTGERLRLSPEYLNWAAGKAAGRPSDGNFFHNALAGFEKHGICSEASMPYGRAFEASIKPSNEAAAEAKRFREQTSGQLIIRWIVPWKAGKSGVSEEQFAEIRRVLAKGYPVAAGSSHSRLLVGFNDDPALPGGGEFITQDSALNRFDKVTFDFVRREVNDAFWIEAVGSSRENAPR